MVTPKQSADLSTLQLEPHSTLPPEQIVSIECDQRKSIDSSHSCPVKQGLELQADLDEPTDVSNLKVYGDVAATQPDCIGESSSERSQVMPDTHLEPTRISYSAISSSRPSESDDEELAPAPKYRLKVRADRDSPPRPQPWNLDDSYPWTNRSPKLEVTLPQHEEPPEQSSSAIPRFKLKINRASSSTSGTTKISKQRRSLESPLQAKFDVSNDLFRASAFGRKPRPSITIGQENSSQLPHLQTRFKESFEQPSATFAISPTITLVPPSPGLNLEARSFFSDDSSQTRNKGSIRKRLSQLRAMASRNTMSEEGRSFDRGILRSRASGRISKQSNRTAESLSHFKSVRSKVVEKVKAWLLRGSERVRGLWKGRNE